ncbi:ABC transporter substrate-binding protein [Chelativorans sp. J32]|uniref:ABC transporter substrate-binding protein n=1 Tax=Chelativorans sp. J32 TaxID=935840 RepID=UPI0004B0BD9B|nr:ABC transporter substrate-binding protein [Chelativorans sp. J32]
MSNFTLTRRHLLATTASAGLALGLGPIMPAAAAAEKRTLRLADGNIGQADPHKPVDFPGSILMFNLYDFLVRPLPRGELEPSVAQSWEISEDGKTYTFTIRDGIKFHDGSTLTAEDVVFSANRMITMKRGYAFLFSAVESVEQEGNKAVFKLKEPFSPFLAALVRLAIVNKKLVMANLKDGEFGEFKDYGGAFLSSADAGSGPYRIVTHDSQSETVMEIYPDYFAGFASNPPEVIRSKFSVEAVAVRQLMPRREIDLTRLPLPPEIVLALSKSEGISIGQDRKPSIFHFKMNTRKAPLDDVNVRKAIALAFDYEQLYGLLQVAGQQQGIPIRGPIPADVPGYDPDVPLLKRDIEAAKAALAQSKYAGQQHEFDLVWFKGMALQEKFALLLQANLAELGIKVNITSAPWPQIVEMATSPEASPHLACVATSLSTTDVDSMLWGEYHSSSAGTYLSMHWLHMPEIDAALEKGRQITDAAERHELYKELAKTIADQYPSVFMYQGTDLVAFQNYLKAPGFVDPAASIPIMAGNYRYDKMTMDV